MEFRSVQYNSKVWKTAFLGESALLLQADFDHALTEVHLFTANLESAALKEVKEVVPAYESIAIIFDPSKTDHSGLIETINSMPEQDIQLDDPKTYEIGVNYESGIDWERVCNFTGLQKEKCIDIHSSAIYTIAMIGFLPGFIFLSGLDERLKVPRLESPRTRIKAGTVGIGGNQTGIYSVQSPGGWNSIGHTDHPIFNASQDPPISMKAGDRIIFRRL